MARLTATLAGRIGATVIALHAIMLPLLFYGVDWTVRNSNEDRFVNHVRAYTKLLSEEIEAGTMASTAASMASFLDSLALSGEINYAEFVDGDQVVRSSLLPTADNGQPPNEDYYFGGGDDSTYFVSTVLVAHGRSAKLTLGFDEQATLDTIAETRRGVVVALLAYMAAVMLAAWLLSYYLARPIKELRAVSRRIASGDFSQRMHARSRIQEMSDLATDLETMRRELVGVNTRLAGQIAERSRLEAQLRQKQRLETVGTLAGGVAHEFNNILVPMTLYTEMALDTLQPDHPARSDLQRVMSAVRRATSVVGKILTFGRHFDSSPSRPVDIAAAVDEGLRLFAALRPTNVELRTDVAASCSPVVADSTSIVQVVMNLCTNAYQSMRTTGGVLQVSLRDLAITDAEKHGVEVGNYVELIVSDTGHGMDEATRERIFEPFFTTRDIGEGTGLGLSVVHGIATSMGATIQVSSEPGEGAKFRILIPAATDPAENSGATHV